MAEMLLTFDNIRAGYDEAIVLDGISFEVPEHGSLAVSAVMASEVTLILTIMGFTQVKLGKVTWRGADITRLSPHRRANAGLGWVAQEREIFRR